LQCVQEAAEEARCAHLHPNTHKPKEERGSHWGKKAWPPRRTPAPTMHCTHAPWVESSDNGKLNRNSAPLNNWSGQDAMKMIKATHDKYERAKKYEKKKNIFFWW